MKKLTNFAVNYPVTILMVVLGYCYLVSSPIKSWGSIFP